MVCRLHQRHLGVFRHLRVQSLQVLLHEVVQLGRKFAARRAPPNNDEVQQSSLLRFAGARQAGRLEAVNHLLADLVCIIDLLKARRRDVLGCNCRTCRRSLSLAWRESGSNGAYSRLYQRHACHKVFNGFEPAGLIHSSLDSNKDV